MKPGDRVLVSRKPTGTLILSNLLPGRRLYLLGTGTGLAPFLSLIKGPEPYECFETVILVHGCRTVAELAYGELITERLPQDEVLGEMIRKQLIYFPTVTREPFHNRGRITELLESGRLFEQLGLPPLDCREDRVMVCGSPGFLQSTRHLLEERGLREGVSAAPGHFAIEKAFLEK